MGRTKRDGAKPWVRRVKTVSTAPPPGLGSAIRMVQYFINRGGTKLSATRRRELERAKKILQEKRDNAAR